MRDRTILHCDLNNFYASVEAIGHPEYKKRPVAVCGDPERRHGIILAKNEEAKKFGVKTGESIIEARRKCRNLLLLPAHHDRYAHYSEAMRNFYRRYTDKIESFGIDECWLDVTESTELFGDGLKIANDLRALARCELGLTISAGISFNKTFAKIGSDYKKPDASTLISRENYKELIWHLPVEDFMFVGPSTARKLRVFGMKTVGDLANYSIKTIGHYFGRPGLQLHAKANGFDPSPVMPDAWHRPPQSIGNSVTCPRDLVNEEEVRTVLFMLCDSVATRLRRHELRCTTLALHLRTKDLHIRSIRSSLSEETELSTVLFEHALILFKRLHSEGEALRGLGISAEKLVDSASFQLSFLDRSFERAKKEQLEKTVDSLRSRFGRDIIGSALYLTHPDLTLDHPLGQCVHPDGNDDSPDFSEERECLK